MNYCSRLQRILIEAADGIERDPAARVHLASCADCGRAAAESARLTVMLRGIDAPMLPKSFELGLQAKLAAAEADRNCVAPMFRPFAAFRAIHALRPRQAALSWGAGLAAAAVGGILIAAPHLNQRIGGQGLSVSPPSGNPARIAPLPASLPQGDAAFIAECSSQQAQFASAQSLGDPSATVLAANLDETRVSSMEAQSGAAAQPQIQ